MKAKNKIKICSKCESWIRHDVYKNEGRCSFFENAFTRDIHVCQKEVFEHFPDVYKKIKEAERD